MFQLSFLNLSLLFFAAATILPLLIWLLARKKPKQIIFSTIRFIKHTEQEQKSRTKLRNILLLIIRMLIILLVVLAAARPALRLPHVTPGKSHPATALAILLDTSYSMDYTAESKSTLENAKAALQQINKQTTHQDMVCLITSDEGWNKLNAQLYSGQIPESVLGSIKTTWQPLSLDKMLALAETKLQESQLSNREVYVLTDNQAQPLLAKPSLPVMFIPLLPPLPWNNISCSEVQPIVQLTNKQQNQAIQFTLTNHGKTERKDVLVSVELNGVKAAEKFVTLKPEQRLTDQLPLQINTSGWQSGYVEVLDEHLTADNRCYFAFPYDLHPKVGVITREASLPLILRSILSVYASGAGNLKNISPDEVSLQSLKDYNFLVIYSAGNLTARLRQFMGDWNQAGKGLLIIADKDLDSGWKGLLSQMYGVQMGQFVPSPQPLTYANPYHAVSSLLDAEQIKRTSVAGFWSSQPGGKTTPLLATGNNALALADQNNLLWLFDPAVSESRFLLEAYFPVFAFRSFQFLENSRFEADKYTVGQLVSADTVILPEGQTLDLNGSQYKLNSPGIYSLQWRSGSSQQIAVQPDYKESEYKPLVIPKQMNYHILSADWQKQLFLSRLGHDLWKICLLVALLLLILEILLVKSEEWKKDTGQSS